MQMTEDTFDWVKSRIAADEPLIYADLYEPEASIRFGTYYMAICLERYAGDVSTAAAAYHSGWGTVDGLLKDSAYTDDGAVLTVFPYNQMNHYVGKINRNYQKYLELYA
jgi:soluble lytic murein transglycosylase